MEYTEFPILEDDLSYEEFFEEYILKNKPCLIRSKKIVQAWASWRDWRFPDSDSPNLEFIYGLVKGNDEDEDDLIVPVSDCKTRYFNSQKCVEMTFREFFDYFTKAERRSENSFYLKDWHFVKDVPSDYIAYETPEYFSSDWLNECMDYKFVYIGKSGTWTPFHCDVFGSFSWSANVVGLKEWIFFPPGTELRFKDKFGNLPYDINDVDDHGGLKVLQRSGEIIFVPSGWYHQVKNLKDTISINHNWFNGANVHIIWENLVSALGDVEKELSDIKDSDEEWTQTCQDLLRMNHGMNYEDFLEILTKIVSKRIEENYSSHQIRFDLTRIRNILPQVPNSRDLMEMIDNTALKLD